MEERVVKTPREPTCWFSLPGSPRHFLLVPPLPVPPVSPTLQSETLTCVCTYLPSPYTMSPSTCSGPVFPAGLLSALPMGGTSWVAIVTQWRTAGKVKYFNVTFAWLLHSFCQLLQGENAAGGKAELKTKSKAGGCSSLHAFPLPAAPEHFLRQVNCEPGHLYSLMKSVPVALSPLGTHICVCLQMFSHRVSHICTEPWYGRLCLNTHDSTCTWVCN